MSKGKITGNPTNIVCWLQGGYFHDTVYSIAYDKDNLLSEIELKHYENANATAQGIQILGITKASPADVVVFETYELMKFQDTPPAFAIYACKNDGTNEKWGEERTKLFIQDKGYDLPIEHLDPTNMPGETKEVEIK